MDCESGREPRASELPDDLEDTRIISGLPDEATQVRRVKLAVCTGCSLDLIMHLAFLWIQRL